MAHTVHCAVIALAVTMFLSSPLRSEEHDDLQDASTNFAQGEDEASVSELEACTSTWDPIWRQAPGANEWWIEYELEQGGAKTITLEIPTRGAVALEPAWGKWVASSPFPIPAGSLVSLRATDTSGRQAVTLPFPYLDEPYPITEVCSPACVPKCTASECGPDGCGGFCGACGEGATCEEGVCVAPLPCVPSCIDRACGDDGCGALCGVCGEGERCVAGGCAPEGCVPSWSPSWSLEEVSNPWWVSFELGGGRIKEAQLEIVGERTVTLFPEWGRWRAGLGASVETGTPVVLHVENSIGQRASSEGFGYRSGEVIRLDLCSTTGISTCAPLERGMVTLQFDDNSESQYLLARDLLMERGLLASFVLNARPFVGEWPGYLTVDQATVLVGDGHEVVAHNFDHVPLSQLTPGEMSVQMTTSKSWLEENLQVIVRHYAAPDGEAIDEGRAQAARYFDSYRSALGGMNYVGDSPYVLDSDVVFAWTSAAEIRALIDAAREERAWRILVWHRLTTDQPDNDYPPAYNIDGFEAALDYLLSAGVDIVTIEEGLTRTECTSP